MKCGAIGGAGLAGLALAVVPVGVAGAHVTVQPAASRPGDLQIYRVIVPNERERASTTEIDVQVPVGVDFVLVEQTPGWRTRVVRSGGKPRELRWSRGRIAPDGYGELHFIARNPVRTGVVTFKALQRYSNGDVQRWIGTAAGDSPAPRVRLGEDVTPQDVVSVNGERLPSAKAAGTAAAPTAAKDDSDGVARTLAIVAVALAAIALVLTRIRR